jgi:aspartate dehydrogenase
MNVLLIGHGAIGATLMRAMAGEEGLRITQVLARPASIASLQKKLDNSIPVIGDINDVSRDIDCAVECAGHAAVKEHVPALLRRGIDVILVSVGSLAAEGLAETLEAAAREGGSQLTLVPGAVAGIDALAAAKPFGLDEVTYTGRKPPLGWLDTEAEKLCDLRSLKAEAVLFEGSAREAARRYPKNANVAATIALAGVGMDATRVRLIADPSVSRNVHTLHASGAFGDLDMTIAARPLPDNPKTSALAAYSVIRALRMRVAPVAI